MICIVITLYDRYQICPFIVISLYDRDMPIHCCQFVWSAHTLDSNVAYLHCAFQVRGWSSLQPPRSLLETNEKSVMWHSMCKVVAYDRQHEYPNLNSSITHTSGFPSSNRHDDIIIQSTLNNGIKCYISVMIRVNLVMKIIFVGRRHWSI